MSKGVIIYRSKYGAAKIYAEWLSEMTGFECVDIKKSDPNQVFQSEIIILCGGVYASGIAGISFLKKNAGRLKGKKTAVFAVGASPYDEKAMEEIKNHNLKGELSEIPVFYGRGAWDEKRMTLPDRTMCRMLQKSVAKKDPDTYEPWMKALMCAVGQSCDWTDREYLTPLLEYLDRVS